MFFSRYFKPSFELKMLLQIVIYKIKKNK